MTLHDETSRLARGAFKRGQLKNREIHTIMRLYGDHDVPVEVRFPVHDHRHSRLITSVTETIGDGKEATVYRCQADPELEHGQVAIKVYRADKFRAFANDAAYRSGVQLRDRRMQRAVDKGSRRGRELGHGDWVEREWQTLLTLFDAGAHIPEPLACSPDSIAMELIGDPRGAAPRLHHVRLRGKQARRALDIILYNVELMLSCDRIHGDLSAYNILYHADRPWLIDLPQAIEASTNPNAHRLLARDVENVCKHFERGGLRTRPQAIADSLWRRFMRAEL
jgi:RIO kinase 1